MNDEMAQYKMKERREEQAHLRAEVEALFARSIASTTVPADAAMYCFNTLVFHEPGWTLLLQLADMVRPSADPDREAP